MEVAVLRGSLDNAISILKLERDIAARLGRRSLEEAKDGRPRGNPTILSMTQSHEGHDIVVTIVFEDRM